MACCFFIILLMFLKHFHIECKLIVVCISDVGSSIRHGVQNFSSFVVHAFVKIHTIHEYLQNIMFLVLLTYFILGNFGSQLILSLDLLIKSSRLSASAASLSMPATCLIKLRVFHGTSLYTLQSDSYLWNDNV